MMELRKLDIQQITDIYNRHMQNDFRRDEIKPLAAILKAIDEGIYDCLGMYDGESITGYAFLVCLGKDYLLDYLAVLEKMRNKGVGSQMLRLLREYLPGASNIIIEAENPEYADDPREKAIQNRRIGFYLRNGCTDTGVRAVCFKVPFILLNLVHQQKDDKEKIRDLYRSFYRYMLPQAIYTRNVIVGE